MLDQLRCMFPQMMAYYRLPAPPYIFSLIHTMIQPFSASQVISLLRDAILHHDSPTPHHHPPPPTNAPTHHTLSNSHPLPIIGPLIPHPSPKIRDAPDFLAVIIRQGVRVRGQGRVDAVFADAGVEVFFFLFRYRY